MSKGPEPSLRERKKRETRQRISNIATLLFAERGFDAVTVAEVARVAGVSAMTVFNYFPRKEDLFLDRIPEAAELFAEAVRGRAPGESPLAALRRLALQLLDQGHPLSGVGERFVYFWRVVIDSPALRARAREGLEEVESALVAALAEAGAADPHLLAALTVAAYRTVYVTSARRLMAGDPVEEVAEDHRARLKSAFAALERMAPQ
ncbi:TetR family transcriptional regulator [Streptomyces cellostaticus]|uniref:TetR family transcriptional regulator n=1 Tax=Streptomyces cellostaticus TaxID=67285 RepID=A0A117PXR0_9ACTN|nr:TetR/AcrR family transcriptional regulator [Streptomyces cellostaticus]KUM97578.1 TetR family transcriptional regulator [Streptomyces cellostaticus]GHI08152.1 TetR family transcriptional regulator [Streptomyces cellostaticus]